MTIFAGFVGPLGAPSNPGLAREGLGRGGGAKGAGGRFPGGIPGKRGGARKSERFCTGRARGGRPERRSTREKPRSRMGRPPRRGGRECRTVRICKTGAGSRGSWAPRRGAPSWREGGAPRTGGAKARDSANARAARRGGSAAGGGRRAGQTRKAARRSATGTTRPAPGGRRRRGAAVSRAGAPPYCPRVPFTASGNTSLKPSLKELGTTMVPPVSRTDS